MIFQVKLRKKIFAVIISVLQVVSLARKKFTAHLLLDH